MPKLFVPIDSTMLGLSPGTLQDLDTAVAQLPREHIILRCISVLHALSADRGNRQRTVNLTFAEAAGGDIRRRLLNVMQKDNANFLEPLQQLLVLRRAMAVCNEQGNVNGGSGAAIGAYFDACRFAADVASAEFKEEDSDTRSDRWMKVATALSMRLWLTNPINPNFAIARDRLILDRVPTEQPELKPHADTLKARFPATLGLTYDEVFTLVQFLCYWTMGADLNTIFADPSVLRLNPDTWLRDTTIPADKFKQLLQRIARAWNEKVAMQPDLSLLPFRDRPLITFADASVAPVTREFILEKLTADLFWWTKDVGSAQQHPWQTEWGKVVEGYALWLLEKIAATSNCGFKANISWQDGEVDAAIWFKGHVALFEITASSLTEAAGSAVDWKQFRAGLHQTFVESTRPGKPPKAEVVLQLARDAKALIGSELQQHLPIDNLQRLYPVMIAMDRRIKTPGAWHYLNDQLSEALGTSKPKCAALAPWNIDDTEEIEQLLHDRRPSFGGTPPGVLRILRRWDTDRGAGPSWWQFMEYLAGDVPANRQLVAESEAWRQEIKSHFHVDPWEEDEATPTSLPSSVT
jgi:hypothetical protein